MTERPRFTVPAPSQTKKDEEREEVKAATEIYLQEGGEIEKDENAPVGAENPLEFKLDPYKKTSLAFQARKFRKFHNY